MNTTDPVNQKIFSIDDLDHYLSQTLLFLFNEWYKKDVGIVACCLKDDDKIAYATSKQQNKIWLHAEKNAYLEFKKLHGEPSKNAVFIVTLSPCLKELKHRDGASCSQLIKNLGITRVHFGVLDTFHTSSTENYNSFNLTATVTENKNLRAMCKKLMAMFSIYDSRINNELLSIKKELGDEFFHPVITVN